MTQWILFAVGSVAIMAISWKSLIKPGSHGFYRFFAWESMLGLLLVNVKSWFIDPFSWNQIIAWFLLIVCLVPLAFGVHSLRTNGKPVRQRESDPSLLAFEKTTQLVTSGIYHYIRHPLYSSLFLLTWGIFFKSISWLAMALAGTSTLFLVLTARADETECAQFFGTQYREYMEKTKMFIPFVY
jgi:protein-S-isoprenylcysteine O-methyltransferase Ste14